MMEEVRTVHQANEIDNNAELFAKILQAHNGHTVQPLSFNNDLKLLLSYSKMNDDIGMTIKLYVYHSTVNKKLIIAHEGLSVTVNSLLEWESSIAKNIPKVYKDLKPILIRLHNQYSNHFVVHIGQFFSSALAILSAIDFDTNSYCFDAVGCLEIVKAALGTDKLESMKKEKHFNYALNDFFSKVGTPVNKPMDINNNNEIMRLKNWFHKGLKTSKSNKDFEVSRLKSQLSTTHFDQFVTELEKNYQHHQYSIFLDYIRMINAVTVISTEGSKNQVKPTEKVKFQIWLQDPSIDIPLQHIELDEPITNGPENFLVKITDAHAARLVERDFVYDPDKYPSEANASHAFAVINLARNLYSEACTGHHIPWSGNWKLNQPIKVQTISDGMQNAYYDPSNGDLVFGAFLSKQKFVMTCRSFDIVSHETGHAILDSIKPHYLDLNLWHIITLNFEGLAFHEAFGDLTTLFCLLCNKDFCAIVDRTCDGAINGDSIISIVGEEFGQHVLDSPLGIRNLNNKLKMNQVSYEPHDLSQPFSGAIFEIFLHIYESRLRDNHDSRIDALYYASQHIRDLLLQAIYFAPDQYMRFHDMAILLQNLEPEKKHQASIESIFKTRGILNTSSRVADLSKVTLKTEKKECGTIGKSLQQSHYFQQFIASEGINVTPNQHFTPITQDSLYMRLFSLTRAKAYQLLLANLPVVTPKIGAAVLQVITSHADKFATHLNMSLLTLFETIADSENQNMIFKAYLKFDVLDANHNNGWPQPNILLALAELLNVNLTIWSHNNKFIATSGNNSNYNFDLYIKEDNTYVILDPQQSATHNKLPQLTHIAAKHNKFFATTSKTEEAKTLSVKSQQSPINLPNTRTFASYCTNRNGLLLLMILVAITAAVVKLFEKASPPLPPPPPHEPEPFWKKPFNF